MIGVVIIVLVLVVLFPVSVLVLGGVVAAVLGHSLKADAEARYEGSELIDLNT